MTWIDTIAYEDSEGELRGLYDRVKGPGNNVDNIMLAHSLRPHTMTGHMTLYKYVLHHPRNELPKSYLETIGVYVSLLNDCSYCVEHHFAGLSRLLGDDDRARAVRAALTAHNPSLAFDGWELAGLEYAARLTVDGSEITRSDIQALREAGLDDGRILEINRLQPTLPTRIAPCLGSASTRTETS